MDRRLLKKMAHTGFQAIPVYPVSFPEAVHAGSELLNTPTPPEPLSTLRHNEAATTDEHYFKSLTEHFYDNI